MTRVLLVDDDRELAELFARQLIRAGFDAQFADSLAGARAIAQAGPPFDVLITDLHLPDADAVEVAEAVKARVQVVLTGSSSAVDARRLREAGFAAVLVKPLTGRQLIDAVALCIRSAA